MAAVIDGVDYCVDLHRPGESRVRRICREFERTAARPDPGPEGLEGRVHLSEIQARILRARLKVENSGLRNSLEAVRFDEAGRLWVRIVDPGIRHSIMLRYPFQELRPERYAWDVWTQEGTRVAQVQLPSGFDPRAIADGTAYGILEIETGEQVIARADVELPR